MSNPLNLIMPILDPLGKEIKILPATGGAVEDLQHPDQEEIDEHSAQIWDLFHEELKEIKLCLNEISE